MKRRLVIIGLVISFVATSVVRPLPCYAQTLELPVPGQMVELSPAFAPVMIKGLKVHPDNPMLFDFLVDTGDSIHVGRAMEGELKEESLKLIKYFLACLAIPEDDLWVNLSPYEKDKMIPRTLGATELGRDLLAQDYVLKQLTASLIYPEKKLGKEFWDRVYAKAQQLYGTTQIPVNTFNKVWILADTAKVFEHNNTAVVVHSHLKVMLDEDYLAVEKNQRQSGGMFNKEQQKSVSPSRLPSDAGLTVKATQGTNQTHTIGSQIIRDLILPEIEQEVNAGKNFTQLRQIFHAFILASWYKKNLREAILNKVYADKKKIKGLEYSNDTSDVEAIYQQYLKAYKKGVFNYIKEEPDISLPLSGDGQGGGKTIPRKYFSGGTRFSSANAVILKDRALLNPADFTELARADFAVTVNLKPANPGPAADRGRLTEEMISRHRGIHKILMEQIGQLLPYLDEFTKLSLLEDFKPDAISHIFSGGITAFNANLQILGYPKLTKNRKEAYQHVLDSLTAIEGGFDLWFPVNEAGAFDKSKLLAESRRRYDKLVDKYVTLDKVSGPAISAIYDFWNSFQAILNKKGYPDKTLESLTRLRRTFFDLEPNIVQQIQQLASEEGIDLSSPDMSVAQNVPPVRQPAADDRLTNFIGKVRESLIQKPDILVVQEEIFKSQAEQIELVYHHKAIRAQNVKRALDFLKGGGEAAEKVGLIILTDRLRGRDFEQVMSMRQQSPPVLIQSRWTMDEEHEGSFSNVAFVSGNDGSWQKTIAAIFTLDEAMPSVQPSSVATTAGMTVDQNLVAKLKAGSLDRVIAELGLQDKGVIGRKAVDLLNKHKGQPAYFNGGRVLSVDAVLASPFVQSIIYPLEQGGVIIEAAMPSAPGPSANPDAAMNTQIQHWQKIDVDDRTEAYKKTEEPQDDLWKFYMYFIGLKTGENSFNPNREGQRAAQDLGGEEILAGLYEQLRKRVTNFYYQNNYGKVEDSAYEIFEEERGRWQWLWNHWRTQLMDALNQHDFQEAKYIVLVLKQWAKNSIRAQTDYEFAAGQFKKTAKSAKFSGPYSKYGWEEFYQTKERTSAYENFFGESQPNDSRKGGQKSKDARAMPTVGSKDYYGILGVHRDATEHEIRKSFRQLALKYHPDKNSSDKTAENFKQINEAYEILRDPKKRRFYNQYGFYNDRSFREENGGDYAMPSAPGPSANPDAAMTARPESPQASAAMNSGKDLKDRTVMQEKKQLFKWRFSVSGMERFLKKLQKTWPGINTTRTGGKIVFFKGLQDITRRRSTVVSEDRDKRHFLINQLKVTIDPKGKLLWITSESGEANTEVQKDDDWSLKVRYDIIITPNGIDIAWSSTRRIGRSVFVMEQKNEVLRDIALDDRGEIILTIGRDVYEAIEKVKMWPGNHRLLAEGRSAIKGIKFKLSDAAMPSAPGPTANPDAAMVSEALLTKEGRQQLESVKLSEDFVEVSLFDFVQDLVGDEFESRKFLLNHQGGEGLEQLYQDFLMLKKFTQDGRERNKPQVEEGYAQEVKRIESLRKAHPLEGDFDRAWNDLRKKLPEEDFIWQALAEITYLRANGVGFNLQYVHGQYKYLYSKGTFYYVGLLSRARASEIKVIPLETPLGVLTYHDFPSLAEVRQYLTYQLDRRFDRGKKKNLPLPQIRVLLAKYVIKHPDSFPEYQQRALDALVDVLENGPKDDEVIQAMWMFYIFQNVFIEYLGEKGFQKLSVTVQNREVGLSTIAGNGPSLMALSIDWDSRDSQKEKPIRKELLDSVKAIIDGFEVSSIEQDGGIDLPVLFAVARYTGLEPRLLALKNQALAKLKKFIALDLSGRSGRVNASRSKYYAVWIDDIITLWDDIESSTDQGNVLEPISKEQWVKQVVQPWITYKNWDYFPIAASLALLRVGVFREDAAMTGAPGPSANPDAARRAGRNFNGFKVLAGSLAAAFEIGIFSGCHLGDEPEGRLIKLVPMGTNENSALMETYVDRNGKTNVYIEIPHHQDLPPKFYKWNPPSSGAKPDQGMKAVERHGGIDLKTKSLKLDIQKQDSGVQINVDPAMIEEFQSGNFTGMVPVIIRIIPINGAWSSLGLQPSKEREQIASGV